MYCFRIPRAADSSLIIKLCSTEYSEGTVIKKMSFGLKKQVK